MPLSLTLRRPLKAVVSKGEARAQVPPNASLDCANASVMRKLSNGGTV
ncbi:hypothetical protein ABIA96_005983 [Bradyrhizobium sp. LB11.1]